MYAARSGCYDCVESLLGAGANPNLPTPEGVSPLMIALDDDNMDVAKLLLERGANPNVWDWWGRTALYITMDRKDGGSSGGIPNGLRTRAPAPVRSTALGCSRALKRCAPSRMMPPPTTTATSSARAPQTNDASLDIYLLAPAPSGSIRNNFDPLGFLVVSPGHIHTLREELRGQFLVAEFQHVLRSSSVACCEVSCATPALLADCERATESNVPTL
ncbi:MAG: ankyrin repeat domain-containing protein [Acidobacteriia bacterium]|nr:ankyrin repeat domain-containing protein [Terriglobia bacterium]